MPCLAISRDDKHMRAIFRRQDEQQCFSRFQQGPRFGEAQRARADELEEFRRPALQFEVDVFLPREQAAKFRIGPVAAFSLRLKLEEIQFCSNICFGFLVIQKFIF